MVDSSDARDVSVPIEELEYMHASNINVSDFVTVKFSKPNITVWKHQMRCLMKSQMMDGMVEEDDTAWRRDKSDKLIEKYEHLLRGWLLGSILLGDGIKDDLMSRSESYYSMTAKQLWKYPEKLCKSDYVSLITGVFQLPDTDQEQEDNMYDIKLKMYDAALEGSWKMAKLILKSNKEAATEEISANGNTMLHLAVGEGNNYFVQKLLNFIKEGELIEKRNQYDQAPLHIAAIVGNTEAAKLLVEKRKELLYIPDSFSDIPLLTAIQQWEFHTHTFVYLSEVTENRDGYLSSLHEPLANYAVSMLIMAISMKQYDLALKFYSIFDGVLIENDDEVLMTLIRNFPGDLGFGEALIYPSLENINQNIVKRSSLLFNSLEDSYTMAESTLWSMRRTSWWAEIFMILLVPVAVLYPIYQLILFLILVLLFPLFMCYLLLWKAFAYVVPTITSIEKKMKEYKQAQDIMEKIYKGHKKTNQRKISKLPILEAVRLDVYSVFYRFLHTKSDTLVFLPEDMQAIMQEAIINRSITAYNFFYPLIDVLEFNMKIYCSTNNLAHVAGKLPPLDILNCTRGAALQIQRELQWFEEVSKLVKHRLLMERNMDDETPEMVFTREHADLVKEGENWMKTTAESCSITAALIVTIVFAAAITVPGGNNQDTGLPLFRKDIAFTVFAVCDAISLFTGATSLSVFLSILTTRFAEKDFLVVLPRRLLIGLSLLLISTTTMMIAFSTTLYIVFCDQRPWMLAPIGSLTCVPIAAIVFLQFPLIFDLFHSTYFPIFGKEQRKRSYSKEE